MEKDDTNYSGGGFLEFNGDHEHHLHHHQQQQQQQQFMVKNSSYENNNGNQMVDYLINNPIQHLSNSGGTTAGFCSPNSFDKLSFADVMQFADLGPKLALNQNKTSCQEDQETGIDPIYFLKFPVLNERIQEDHHHQSLLPPFGDDENVVIEGGERSRGEEDEARVCSEGNNNNMSVRLQFIGDQDVHKTLGNSEGKNKRKRPRTIKTSEEVESQRMTHIAVERNRRKQMNEHLRVLRSLMPGSYVQRGDQASIIGGAIEFVRELEQLLQCLESQKRRKLYGENTPRVVGDSSSLPILQQAGGPPAAVFYPPPPTDDEMKLVEYDGGLKEEAAESKSCLADVEVRVLGFDAMIKILCRRRPGQLIKTIAALEDLQFNILHTNITTIEQTVLYSFNVKVTSEVSFSAEDIANSVQQIISFVHENTAT